MKRDLAELAAQFAALCAAPPTPEEEAAEQALKKREVEERRLAAWIERKRQVTRKKDRRFRREL